MQIEKDKVVTFHYTLSEHEGDVIENNRDGDPMAYLHGHANLLPALEKTLAGKQASDQLSVTLTPDQAYGHRKPDSVSRVPIKHLLTKGKLKPGMLVAVNTKQGRKDATVVKVGKFNVDIDNNHPLAGKTLVFDIEIAEVRDATAEELAHGHSHGVGGHHH